MIYIPRALPGLVIERLFDERYLMLTPQSCHLDVLTAEEYVFIDWSPHFKSRHLELLPHLQATAVSVGLGSMAMDHILEKGRAAYFPERTADRLIANGQMQMVQAAPIIEQPVYLVATERVRESNPLTQAIQILKDCVPA